MGIHCLAREHLGRVESGQKGGGNLSGRYKGRQIKVGIYPNVSHTHTHTKCMDRQLANVRQEYELKINVSSYIKHALK